MPLSSAKILAAPLHPELTSMKTVPNYFYSEVGTEGICTGSYVVKSPIIQCISLVCLLSLTKHFSFIVEYFNHLMLFELDTAVTKYYSIHDTATHGPICWVETGSSAVMLLKELIQKNS